MVLAAISLKIELLPGRTTHVKAITCPCYNFYSPEGFTVEAILMISSVGEFIIQRNALGISAI
jgi:hypothetical protein